jgi:hypothetical protein
VYKRQAIGNPTSATNLKNSPIMAPSNIRIFKTVVVVH